MKLFYADPDKPLSKLDVFIIKAAVVVMVSTIGVLVWGQKWLK